MALLRERTVLYDVDFETRTVRVKSCCVQAMTATLKEVDLQDQCRTGWDETRKTAVVQTTLISHPVQSSDWKDRSSGV